MRALFLFLLVRHVDGVIRHVTEAQVEASAGEGEGTSIFGEALAHYEGLLAEVEESKRLLVSATRGASASAVCQKAAEDLAPELAVMRDEVARFRRRLQQAMGRSSCFEDFKRGESASLLELGSLIETAASSESGRHMPQGLASFVPETSWSNYGRFHIGSGISSEDLRDVFDAPVTWTVNTQQGPGFCSSVAADRKVVKPLATPDLDERPQYVIGAPDSNYSGSVGDLGANSFRSMDKVFAGRGDNLSSTSNSSTSNSSNSSGRENVTTTTPVPLSSLTEIHSIQADNYWMLALNLFLVLLAFGFIVVMLYKYTPIRGASMTAVENTGEVMFRNEVSRKFVETILPFWVPIEKNSSGVEFAVMLGLMMLSTLFGGYLFAAFHVRLAVVFQPGLFDEYLQAGFDYHIYTDWRAVTLCIIGILVFPAAFYGNYKRMQGREAQWAILWFEYFLTFTGLLETFPMSFIGRAVANWVIQRDADVFWHWQLSFVITNTLIGIPITVAKSFLSTWLQIRWRRFQTNKCLDRYFKNRAYYALNSNGGKDTAADNPDARIQVDVNQMMHSVMNFLHKMVQLCVGLIMSTLIVWVLLPGWIIYCVVYSILGAAIAIWITWQLTRLSFEIQKKEADWRFSMTNVRSNAESIAFYGGEKAEQDRITKRFEAVQEFHMRMMWWHIALEFYTTIYGLGMTLAPTLMLTRMYFQSRLDFGGLGQFSHAMGKLGNHLSFILHDSGNIANLGSAVTRLGGLMQALEESDETEGILTRTTKDVSVEVKNLLILTPGKHPRALHENLSFRLDQTEGNKRLLIVGRSGVGKSSLMRALAGLWQGGDGEIERPDHSDCMFLPQVPYMPLGSLRDQLMYPHILPDDRCDARDAEIRSLLRIFGLADLPERFDNGFDTREDWSRLFSRGEQQRVAAIRCLLHKPKLVMLDEATSALSSVDEDVMYKTLIKADIMFISVGHRPSLVQYHDRVLCLNGGDDWEMMEPKKYKAMVDAQEKKIGISNLSEEGEMD